MRSPRLLLATLAAALIGGCLMGGQAASAPQERDDQLFTELQRQQKWVGEAVAGRATPDELKQAAAGDQDAQAGLRTRFIALVRAADRATWVRQATPVALSQADMAGKASLVTAFDRAGQLRQQSWDAADQIASALASTSGPSALSIDDLRRALLTVQAAAAAEARFAKAGPAQLKATRPPVPEPFIEAAAVLIDQHPADEDGLREFDPKLARARTKIRAALADLRARRPPEGEAATDGTDSMNRASPKNGSMDSGPSTAAETAAEAARTANRAAGAGDEATPPRPAATGSDLHPGEPTGAGEPPPPMTLAQAAPRRLELAAGDARHTLDRRGLPQAILVRPDGNFVFRYGTDSRCAKPPCRSPEELVFAPDGKSVPLDAETK